MIESEKVLERKLQQMVREKLRGVAVKYTSQTEVGYPDRLCLVNDRCFWVELKTTGERPTAIQEYRHRQLRRMGQRVYVVDSTESLEAVIEKERRICNVR